MLGPVAHIMGDEEDRDVEERGEVWDNLTTSQLDQVIVWS